MGTCANAPPTGGLLSQHSSASPLGVRKMSADLSRKSEGAHMSTTPIADYALLSDRHSAALVSRSGSIDWSCFPRFDSPSMFGRLLGEEAGHWSIRATRAT